ncbi:hypothetical protein [Cupriavidus oxalaticus]|uniref:hypothetical protein n=1 Tax=Cupriavidus oxalaticus TaxID=96344 RepID=UPI00316BA619
MNARITSTLAAVALALAGAGALSVSLSQAASQRIGDSRPKSHGYTLDQGKSDSYSDGARVGDKPGLFSTQARRGNLDGSTEGTRLLPAKQNLSGIQLAGRDLTGVSATPGSSDQGVA